jgi:hypothetical protein
MNIGTTNTNQEQVLSVIVNGECNHADVRVEIQDFGYPDLVNGEPDYVDDDRQVMICGKCQAWKLEQDGEWCGVTFMPELPKTNQGEPIHDVQRMPF